MAIVDLANSKESELDLQEETLPSSWESFFSAVCARAFFVLLMVFDLVWFVYLLMKIALYASLRLLFGSAAPSLKKYFSSTWVSLKRSIICALALFVALFSPAFGIMIGCTYFLMYDKKGIEEVVPASLRQQFQGLFAEVKDS